MAGLTISIPSRIGTRLNLMRHSRLYPQSSKGSLRSRR